jgi:hypothetical protein
MPLTARRTPRRRRNKACPMSACSFSAICNPPTGGCDSRPRHGAYVNDVCVYVAWLCLSFIILLLILLLLLYYYLHAAIYIYICCCFLVVHQLWPNDPKNRDVIENVEAHARAQNTAICFQAPSCAAEHSNRHISLRLLQSARRTIYCACHAA